MLGVAIRDQLDTLLDQAERALGREAIVRGYSTLLVLSTGLVTQLARAHAEGRLKEKLVHFTKPRLLIVDELGYLPFEANAAHLFFQLVSRRYERGSVLVASNRSITEWGRHRDPGPAAAPQPRNHDPRRQLPAQIEAPRWPG